MVPGVVVDSMGVLCKAGMWFPKNSDFQGSYSWGMHHVSPAKKVLFMRPPDFLSATGANSSSCNSWLFHAKVKPGRNKVNMFWPGGLPVIDAKTRWNGTIFGWTAIRRELDHHYGERFYKNDTVI